MSYILNLAGGGSEKVTYKHDSQPEVFPFLFLCPPKLYHILPLENRLKKSLFVLAAAL